jgi:hypothetical protein
MLNNVPLVTLIGQVETLVNKCRAIGAIPVITGIVPYAGKPNYAPTFEAAIAGIVGGGIGYPSTTASGVAAAFPGAGLSKSPEAGSLGIGQLSLNAATTATQNTAVGSFALQFVSSGGSNTAVGYAALENITTNTQSTAVGNVAGQNATGGNNTLIGAGSGATLTTGANNTLVGVGADVTVATTGPVTAVGVLAKGGSAYSAAFGFGASATGSGSVAIGTDNAGTGASTTIANEIVLGTALHTVRIKGALRVDTATATTVGAAGAAAAIPTPVGYLPVAIGATVYKIPYVNF